jgi:cell division protein FtsN
MTFISSKSRKIDKHFTQGGTLIGFMLGLVLGLGVAVIVAIFVTRAPVPFMNKTNKAAERVLEGRSATDLPDPNKTMYGKQKQASAPSSAGSAPAPNPSADSANSGITPAPAPNAEPSSNSVLGGILSKENPPPVVVAPPITAPTTPSAPGKDPINDAIKESIEDRTTYQLQAGAFRQQEDAESMKGKLSLLGYESRILTAKVNDETLYRVRVGPYKQLDDMNKARGRMAENKIDVTVIRIKPAN